MRDNIDPTFSRVAPINDPGGKGPSRLQVAAKSMLQDPTDYFPMAEFFLGGGQTPVVTGVDAPSMTQYDKQQQAAKENRLAYK